MLEYEEPCDICGELYGHSDHCPDCEPEDRYSEEGEQ